MNEFAFEPERDRETKLYLDGERAGEVGNSVEDRLEVYVLDAFERILPMLGGGNGRSGLEISIGLPSVGLKPGERSEPDSIGEAL